MSETDQVIDIAGNDVTDMVEQQPVAKVKRTRAPSAYNNFVKQTYSTLSDVPKNERFSRCAQMWKAQKQKMKEEAEKAKVAKPVKAKAPAKKAPAKKVPAKKKPVKKTTAKAKE